MVIPRNVELGARVRDPQVGDSVKWDGEQWVPDQPLTRRGVIGLRGLGEWLRVSHGLEGPDIDIDQAGLTIGRGGDTVLVFDSAGEPVAEFAATEAGIVLALAAAGTGDVVQLPPQTIALTAGIMLAAGAGLVGFRGQTVLSFSGFSGTAVTMAVGAKVGTFEVQFTSNGATARGIDARFEGAVVYDVVSVVDGGSSANVAVDVGSHCYWGVLEQYSKHATVTWGDEPWDWSVSSGSDQWCWAIWRLTTGLSLGSGTLTATIEAISGATDGLKMMNATTYDATATPSLGTDGSGAGVTAPVTVDRAAGGPGAYNSPGYFAVTTGWGPHSISLKLKKLVWSGTTLWDLDEMEAAVVPVVYGCRRLKATGTGAVGIRVEDDALLLHSWASSLTIASGGICEIYGVAYETLSNSGTLTYLRGDRSAYEVETWHADDIEAGTATRHLPLASTDGYVARDDGSKYVNAQLDHSDLAGVDPADHHAVVTLAADLASNLLGLSTQQITLDSQAANLVFAGPASGDAAAPAFRSLVEADMPAGMATDAEVTGAIATHAALQTGIHGLAVTAGKTLSVTHSVTLAAAGDGYTLTVPESLTVAGLAVTNVFTAFQTFGGTAELVAKIAGTHATQSRLAIDGLTSGADAVLSFMEQGSSKWSVGRDDTDNSFKISESSVLGTNTRVTVLPGGTVGVGNPVAQGYALESTSLVKVRIGGTGTTQNAAGQGMLQLRGYSGDANHVVGTVEFLDGRDNDAIAKILSSRDTVTFGRGNLGLYTSDGSAMTEVIRLTYLGRVGFFTPSPSSRVHINVNGVADLDGLIVGGYDNETANYSLRCVDENSNDDFWVQGAGDSGVTVTTYSRGAVGINQTVPQGMLHGLDSIGGFLYWEYDGLDATARTIIPNGTGDVTQRLGVTYVARRSDDYTRAATFSGGDGFLEPGSGAAPIFDDGVGNSVAITVAADGSVTIARHTDDGTGYTYKIALWLTWI